VRSGLRPAALLICAAGAKPPVAAPAQEVSRPLWLEAGIKLIGTREGAGAKDNRTIIDSAKEEGGDIANEFNHDSIPWCPLSANHCLTKVGLKGTETLWALDFAGNWPKLAGLAVGAFAPMQRTGGGHIMMVVSKDQHGTSWGLAATSRTPSASCHSRYHVSTSASGGRSRSRPRRPA